jgi:phosphoglycolate phosphatase-like HAD superfamily hydrolase
MLLLFDVDGTLLLTHGAGVRAMSRAGQRTFGEAFSLEPVLVSGGMDPIIVAQALEYMGRALAPTELGLFEELYDSELALELAHPESRAALLPGVLDVLTAVREHPALTLGLLTGNFERTGLRKLSTLGIDPDWFELCVWGDQAETRPGLVKIALERHAAKGHALPNERVVVIGDTPRDVDCAKQNGCTSVGVCTGYFDRGALDEAGADLVLDDLSAAAPLWALLDEHLVR